MHVGVRLDAGVYVMEGAEEVGTGRNGSNGCRGADAGIEASRSPDAFDPCPRNGNAKAPTMREIQEGSSGGRGRRAAVVNPQRGLARCPMVAKTTSRLGNESD